MLGCVTTHEHQPAGAGGAAAATFPVLVTAAAGPDEADLALAEGADLIDVTGLAGPAAALLREHLPQARLWAGAPVAVDVDAGDAAGDSVTGDSVTGDAVAGDAVAAAIASAAINTWLGVPAIRTRHVRAVRRAIDMTLTVAGSRPPALTTRGLA
jgi:hypothetical protein